jgi:arsenite methyltransferase
MGRLGIDPKSISHILITHQDMQSFVKKLRDMGYERVELIDTTDGKFMSKSEAKRLMLTGSTLSVGRK